MNIGTLNVLSWYRPGAAQKTIEQLEKIGMNITAIQEIRWTDSGHQKIGESVVFYSGSQNQRHEFGTGFVVREELVGSVIEFKPINERMCQIRFAGKWYNYTMLSIHAPTEEKDDIVKEAFYDELERTLYGIPKQDMVVMLGDFNAKVGKEEAFRPVIGSHSLHEDCNDNGIRLVDMAAANNLLIKSTMFEHKRIHKQTWISNDGVTRNQIDHVLVNARYGSNIIDVRSLRGVDADSDHLLVRAKVRARISSQKYNNTAQLPKWNIETFKDDIKKREYQGSLTAHLESSSRQEDVEKTWGNIKWAITKSTQSIVGKKKAERRNSWFDKECEEKIRTRNMARLRMLQNPNDDNRKKYRQERASTRRTFREKKRRQEQEMLENLEASRTNNQTRKFFQKVRSIKGGFRPRTDMFLKTDDGALVTKNFEVMEMWRSYFDQLLNAQQDQGRGMVTYYTADPLVEEPTPEEVTNAIGRLKNNKAPGNDTIPAECLKYGGEIFLKHFHTLILQIWKEEKIPSSWKESVIVPLHKKGDKLQCSNYRGISLINSGYKVWSLVLLERLTPYVEPQLGDYQCGFRKQRSTVDQIFTIRQLMEKCWEYNKVLHQLFVDFKQAYDNVLRVELWNAMIELGIPNKLVTLTKISMEGSVSAVRIGRKLSTFFIINNGLKQGDAISPLLFNIALEKVVRDARTETLLFRTRGPQLILAFADDIDIIGDTTVKVKEEFLKIESAAVKIGLKVNESKTKYMTTSRTERRDRIGQNVTMDQYNFERVQEFKYLGATITLDNNMTKEINNRIQSANRCCFALQKIIRSKNVSRTTKLRIYHSIIRPIMTYACETWTMTKQNETRLRIAERKILRSIYGPVKDETTQQYRSRKNREIEELYGQPDIIKIIKAERLRWAGHVKRQEDGRVVKLAWEQAPTGRRPLGRPRLRWRDNITADLRALNITEADELMMDRVRWRKIVESAKTHPGL